MPLLLGLGLEDGADAHSGSQALFLSYPRSYSVNSRYQKLSSTIIKALVLEPSLNPRAFTPDSEIEFLYSQALWLVAWTGLYPVVAEPHRELMQRKCFRVP